MCVCVCVLPLRGRWNDIIVGDLKKCEMHSNWREQAQDCSMWRGLINAAAEDVYEEMKSEEHSKKDELKQRRESINQKQAQSCWRCSESLCGTKQGWSCEPHKAEAQRNDSASTRMSSLWEIA